MLKRNKSFLLIIGILLNIPLFSVPVEAKKYFSSWQSLNDCVGKRADANFYSYRRSVSKSDPNYSGGTRFSHYQYYISRRNHQWGGGLAKEKKVTGTLLEADFEANWKRKCG